MILRQCLIFDHKNYKNSLPDTDRLISEKKGNFFLWSRKEMSYKITTS